jgi:ATP-dependent DNA helicase RecG
VGRSELPSYCLLLSESENPHSLERLNALTRYHNGFDLAEFDLKQRGAGDIMGELQSGWGSLRFASLADQNLLKVVQQGVALVLSQDSSLNSWPELKTRLDHLHFHPE